MMPDFLIAGAQKSGTTWLQRRLMQHPGIFLPDKEVHFFDKSFNYEKGFDWYRSHFRPARPHQVVGEKTPDYMWASDRGAEGHLPDVPARIQRTLPNVKLVFVLRDPVDRALSATKHIVISGRAGPWHEVDDLMFGECRHLLEGHGIIDKGRYAKHLSAYLKHFSPEQMLIMIFEEDVVGAPRLGLRKTCRFLGVDETHEFEDVEEPANPSRTRWIRAAVRRVARLSPLPTGTARFVPRMGPLWEPEVSDAVVDRLVSIYREENQRLFELLGREVPTWRG